MNLSVRVVFFSVLCSSVFATAVMAYTECPPKEMVDPCACFQEDPMTTYLSCSHITGMEILVGVFDKMGDIKIDSFNLEHSSVMYIPGKSMDKFNRLFVWNVRLTSLFDEVPPASNRIEKLHLRNAFLQRGVRWELLKSLSQLTSLEVEETEVKKIDKSFVENMAGKKLIRLHFTATKTSELDDRAFAELPNLLDISVTKNKIKVLKRSMFARQNTLQILVFNENEIETLPEDIFSDMRYIRIVKFIDNRISKISEATFGGIFQDLYELSLYYNPVVCDCSIEWLASRWKLGKIYGSCVAPFLMKGLPLEEISEYHFNYCRQSPLSHRSNSLEGIVGE